MGFSAAATLFSEFAAEALIADVATGIVMDAATGAVLDGLAVSAIDGAIYDVASGAVIDATTGAATGAVVDAGAVAAGTMPESYWSMLADASGGSSAAAGTLGVEIPAGFDFASTYGAGATGLSLGELGAGSLLGGGAGSVVAGGAGALGLSAETVAAMQALGYSGAEIASMGGSALNGFNAFNAAPPLSAFDKFINGVTDNPVRSALSAGQMLSGISTANRAMSPQQARAMADPFSASRPQYVNQLNALMANPSLAMSQPGYQFQRQQGEQAIDRKLAARGMGSYTPDGRGSASGGADIARMKYGQEYALGSYNDYIKQLSGLAGATQAPGVGGQAALSAQAAAAKAATEGWSAINQGIGTADKIMKAAPSGNPNNSGWSAPAPSGFQWGTGEGSPANVSSNTATDSGGWLTGGGEYNIGWDGWD